MTVATKRCPAFAGHDGFVIPRLVRGISLLAAIWLLCCSFTIHLMGDSTMAEKNLPKAGAERGWGMMLQNFLDPGAVTVVNYAQNGRSTKSFIDLGLWQKVYDAVRPGDYVFIQFGHNDSKKDDPARYAAPWGAYQDNLRLFIDGVREKGGTPVLLTPVARRWFKGGALDRSCHGDYPAAMKAVAEEKAVTLLDMTECTLDWLESIGDEASKAYFMISTGKDDNTHTVASGARKVTELVCEAIRARLPEVAAHLRFYHFVVDQTGHGDFLTVQEAIDACPDYSHAEVTTIHINAGVYKEEIVIPHNKFRLRLSGDGAENTVLTFDKYAKKNWPGRDFPMGTSGSASVYIHASYITFEDLTFENSAGEGKNIAQAVAVFTDGDFLFFHRCRFLGNQDTLYTYGRYGKDGGIKRNYFLDCYIEGTTDFIFGPGIAYFENCTIHSKKNSYVTAASTLPGQKYGYVFKNCTLTADPGITKCYLGRPWGAYAKTVFIDCWLGDHILPDGWHDWEKEGKPNTKENAYYAEYGSTGPGARGPRVSWSHQLSAEEAAEYRFDKVMYQEQDGIVWNPLPLSLRVVRSEMARCPEATFLDGLEGKLKWNYTTGLELKAFLDAAEISRLASLARDDKSPVISTKAEGRVERSVLGYVDAWYDAIIDEAGRIYKYKKSNFSTDHICPGRTLFALYDLTGKEKYRAAMDSLYSQLRDQPRTPEGGFWHKQIYPDQMWLDGLYMAQPFYAEYTARYVSDPAERARNRADICHQFETVYRGTWDERTGLLRHAWDSSHKMFWCDPETGQSAHAWGRALGWYVMALVDVIEILPRGEEEWAGLAAILQSIYEVLPRYADPATGMWYQVLDCPGREGNYLEATCNAMFVYAWLKGIRLGVLGDPDGAKAAYASLLKTFVSEEEGLVTLHRCCEVAGLGGKEHRSGDYDYYIHERVRDNDPKGIGPLISAALEYEKLR